MRLTAKSVETITFVIVFAIPPAVLEWQAGMIWWTILLSRLFNIVVNAATLVYSQRLGTWLAAQFPTFAKMVSPQTGAAINSLAAVLLMQLPATAAFLTTANAFLPVEDQAFTGPLAIAAGLGVVIWAYELWICPYCERRIPWLHRLITEPVKTTRTAARGMAGHVARGTGEIRKALAGRGSRARSGGD